MPKWIAQSMLTHTENGPAIPPFGAEWHPLSLDHRRRPLAESLQSAMKRVVSIRKHIKGGASHIPPQWRYAFRLRQARGTTILMVMD